MSSVSDILSELEQLGTEQTRKVLRRHGARDPFYGVKVEHLQKIRKRIKVDHPLALDLYATGISDAMYLAALIADPPVMKKADLNRWVQQAYWSMLSEYAVPWVAAESPHGWELARKWIDSKRETIAEAGWSTFSNLLSIIPNEEIDLDEMRQLLDRCASSLHEQPNRVRYTMNGFVIAAGSYVPELTADALAAAKQIGLVRVDMGETECKVPDAAGYIAKIESMKRIGKKRKSARC